MVIHQSTKERAHVRVQHDKSWERQPARSTQPPPASKFRRQPDFTPKAVGTWAAENKGSRVLCQAYQQNRCAGNSGAMVAHVWAMVVRDSGHICAMKPPVCRHRWDMKPDKQDGRRNSERGKRRCSPAVGVVSISQPTVCQKQQTAETRPLGQPVSLSPHDVASRGTSARPSAAPEVTPPQGTTSGTEVGGHNAQEH